MTRAERDALAALMKRYGIQQSYRAASGQQVSAPTEAVIAVLTALGVEMTGDLVADARRAGERTTTQMHEPVLVAWEGRLDLSPESTTTAALHTDWELQLEAGDIISGRAAHPLPVLPAGYHMLRTRGSADTEATLVISAPRHCHDRRAREWGVFAPLYALRDSADQPIGDFDDLAACMRWIAELDGDVMATLPVSAAFLRSPFEPSPYAPASRLFWNEIHLSMDDDDAGTELLDAAADQPLVDYRATARLKRALLEPKATQFFSAGGADSPAFREFVGLYPDAEDYARFRAAGEQFASGWITWPARAAAGDLGQSDYAEAAVRFHLYAQLLAHRQLAQLASHARESRVRLYLDLPLGVHSDSYDIWRNRELFVTAVSAGAPPDPFFTKGQNWGFPPLHPLRLRTQHYGYWRRVLQTQLRYAGILRLDHVMALHRLYVVPHGFDAAHGVYVRYPADELYAVLTLESARHQATIVGEDLGTVPAEVRKAMARHRIKRMFVVQFEAVDDVPPIGPVPAGAVASLNTHDMPTFRAYWEGRDADLRHELGLIDEAGVAAAHATRRRIAASLSGVLGARDTLDAAAARDALYRLLARSHADIVLLNLEDLWLEVEPQNVPGTAQERPNWRRRLRYTLGELRADANVRDALEAVARARRTAGGQP